jgi:hypothetical protein
MCVNYNIRLILLTMGNVSNKNCRENQNTHFMFNNPLPAPHPVSCAGQATGDSIRRRMRLACWIPQSIVTHPEYVILITFSTATVVPRTRLTVTCTLHCRLV